uniref:Inositol-1-monophosphatase n=1 Tax=Trypanosoma congolense (strain IL3000) TaxID=1068625 RepID=G0UN02_TRYCI|nr:putative inositol-1(or 4)-monophosphatase 1 [Trypanosoma congolense IL3000]
MTVSDAELDAVLQLALRAAHVAACTTDKAVDDRDTASNDFRIRQTPTDLAIQNDKQCEEEVVSILREGAPHYEIIIKDSSSDAVLTDKPTWVVDVTNGSDSFIHGLFDFCVSIALVVGKEPVVGVVNAPPLHEVFSAVRGRGAYCNGQRIHVSPCDSINRSVVYIRDAALRDPVAVTAVVDMQKDFTKMPVHALRAHGSTALDMCFIASGRAELLLEAGVNPWDIAAGAIIVREAGGVVHDIDNADSLNLTSHTVCCANSLEIARIGMNTAAKHMYKRVMLGN